MGRAKVAAVRARVAMVTAGAVMASGVWAITAALAPVAMAVEQSPSTYRYDPEDAAGDPLFYSGADYAATLSEDGLSVGFLNEPVLPTFGPTTLTVDEGAYLYMVADALEFGAGRAVWSLEAPGVAGPHAGQSQLSGDGLTFVATYSDSGRAGGPTCWDDGDPGTPDSLYWQGQVLRWQREDRGSDFGDPELVSIADPADCNGVPSGQGPDLMGVGGDDASLSPSVSDDGTVVAFSSMARNLPTAPTAAVSALYVAAEESGQLVPRMVTPANLNGEVRAPMISGDGDHIVFVSSATNLVSGVTPPTGGELVYMATRGSGSPSSWSFEVVSTSTGGTPAASGGDGAMIGPPSIDATGERIAYVTNADNLDASVVSTTGLKVAVRHTPFDTTRLVTNGQDLDGGGQLTAYDLGFDAARAHITRDGERIATYTRRATADGSRLVLINADDAFDADPADRREARMWSKHYRWTSNLPGHVAIEGGAANPGGGYVAVFPSATVPNAASEGHGSALYFVGGGVLGQDAGRGWHGDPVDTANGAFRQDEVDLTAPTGAGPAVLSRSHSSVGEMAGAFGAGWTSTIDERLELDIQNGTVALARQNGSRTTFVDDGSGWRTSDGTRLSIEPIVDGWTVTDPGGGIRTFDEAGRLVGWSRPDEPAITVQWSGDVPIGIDSASGYGIDLVDDTRYQHLYDPMTGMPMGSEPVSGTDGFVDRAVTSDGRQVDYGYILDLGGATRLSTVSRPHAVGQTVGTFGVRTYTWESSWITGIVDQVDGTRSKVVVENTYDDAGRVLHQVTDTGDELDFVYGQRPDGLGGMIDAPGFTTVTNDASGDVTVYEYNDIGEVVGITDALGHDLARSWDADRPDASTSRSGVISDQVYDDAGRLIELTETAGATTRTLETITYVTPDSSPAALTDDRVQTRTDEAGVTTTYGYDGAERQPETVSVPCDPASTHASTPCPMSGLATTTFTYYPSGTAEGLVESVTDPDGVVTEYAYADDRSIETVTTYDGATPLVTTYDTIRAGDPGWVAPVPEAVEVRTVEAPGGAVSTSIVDAEGRVIESRDPEYDGVTHLATTFSYDLDGQLVSKTDPAGGVTTYSVARAGDPGWAEAAGIAEVRTMVGPDGIHVITKIDRSGDVVVEQRGDPAVPAELATTTHTYGALGRLETTTDPTGVTTTYDHDEDGRLTEVIDEDGEKTVTTYDDFGRPTVVTDQLGETTTTTYVDGRVTAVEDREGHDTTYTFDDAGRPHTTTNARGGVAERRYTLAGRVASETDETGRTTTYSYDTAGRRDEVELPSGPPMVTAYDADGRVETVTSPEGRVTTYTYDDLGRVETVADPKRGTTTTTYWPTGEIKTRTDATGGEVEYTYDGGGRVETVTDPLGRVTTYQHDSRGNRTKRIDARAGEQEWHWNLADQLIEEIDPLDRSTTHTYDPLGRLDITTDGAGRTTDRGYDEAGRLETLTYASGTPTSFDYDGEGRRTEMIDGTGTTVWHYNATGQMTGADLPGSRDLAFAWDLAGRRTVITYPDGSQYRNVYDADGRLWQVEFLNSSSVWVDIAVNDYDDDGLLVEQDQGGSGLREWSHDPVTGRMTGYDDTRGAVTTSTTLTHDAAGRIETETIGGVTTAFGYDDAGQLELIDRATATDTTIVYDELGRRTSAIGADTTTYQWDAASQLTRRVLNGANHNYQYDGSGRRTRESWNGGNRFVQYFWGVRGTLTGHRFTEPGTVTDIARSTRGDGSLAGLTTSVNGVVTDTTSVVWDPTLPVPQPVWTGDPGTANATRAIYGPDLIRFTCPTGTNCTGAAKHDSYGSTLRTTATSAITQDTAFGRWGDGGPTFAAGANYSYRSELHTGDLIHLRNREYDPKTGLFLSPDPLDGVDGTTTVGNAYHYADNDPLNKTDPLGLRPDDWAFDDPCTGPGEVSNGARPSEELESFGFLDALGISAVTLDENGCVPLPDHPSVDGRYPLPWDQISQLPIVGVGNPYPGVTNTEAELCEQDPFACLQAASIKRAAEAEELIYWSGATAREKANEQHYRYLGRTNAFKHVLWSSLLRVVLGRNHAERWAHAHEWGNPVSDLADQMDRANNFYGFRLGGRFGCVCLNAGETTFNADLDGSIRSLAEGLSVHARREVGAGRACWIVNTEPPVLKFGCGQ